MSKTIVITGAGSGLGRSLARRFASDGDNVVLIGRTLSKLDAVAAQIGERATAIQCNVQFPNSVRSAFEAIAARFPKIDVLINNAAAIEHCPLADASDAHILDTIATNLVGPILCSRAALSLMDPGGHIFNVSSGAVERNYPALSVYTSSKSGLERFSEALHEELEPRNICVTVVRTGQMIEEMESWELDPLLAARIKAAAAHGLDARQRPSSTYRSVTNVFRALIDFPADLGAIRIAVRPRSV